MVSQRWRKGDVIREISYSMCQVCHKGHYSRSLTSWPPKWSFHATAASVPVDHLCQDHWHQHRFIYFQNTVFTNSVTDERTDEQMNKHRLQVEKLPLPGGVKTCLGLRLIFSAFQLHCAPQKRRRFLLWTTVYVLKILTALIQFHATVYQLNCAHETVGLRF